MLISGTRYSFIRAGRTVKGPQVSATMAIATVVQTRMLRSWTLRLFRRVCRTSCGPMALAMNPNVLTAARLMAFLCALSISSNSKQILIHSFAETNSAPLSAIRPTKSMQFSCTFSCLFRKIGVSLGNRSRIGGVIFVIPITFTIARRAPRIEPRTSGYSSPRYSYNTTPKWPISWSSLHAFITTAIRATRSAACIRTEAALLLRRHLIVPAICFRYGLHRSPRATTTAPNPSSMIWLSRPSPLELETLASTACS
mmetsp:Transcript_31797/g.53131  ORF Transcript_31797/g.53131 Transcript_31797/m.53131 type:complete len:255 (-) Transcript_31797:1482-2246(-)